MNDNQPPPIEYRCPGEKSPISLAVHLGRLAAFYPACRECPHREDTGSLSPRQVEQLTETAAQRRPRPLFNDEGASGVYLDDLAPADARRIAAAFGVLANRLAASSPVSRPLSRGPHPRVILAGDGRPISAELVASAADGLRWSGCDVIDIGPATAPCLAFAVHHLKAAGGVMVGNPGTASHEAGLQFWTAEPRPLSAGRGLESLAQIAETRPERPTRHAGRMRRFQADEPYLAALAGHYHALRPLRVAVDSASKPALDFLGRLCSNVACEITPVRSLLAGKTPVSAAHFAVQIDGDGETCRFFDEQGRQISPERLLKLLARNIPTQTDLDVLMKTRADVCADMRKTGAALGFGPSARYWHVVGGVPLPDALTTVTWMLKILSRGDEQLSGVLDRDCPEM